MVIFNGLAKASVMVLPQDVYCFLGFFSAKRLFKKCTKIFKNNRNLIIISN